MHLLALGLKLPVAAGLEWQVPREAKEVKSTPKSFARKLHGRVQGPDGDIAFGEDKGDGDKPAKAYCGAGLIAIAAPDAFVYHELPCGEDEEQMVWVCGVGRGVPLPGFDDVVTVPRAREKYNDFVSFNSEAQVYGSLNEARESLLELLARVDEKQRKTAVLVKAGVSLVAVTAAVGVPVLLGAAALVYFQFEDARQRDQLSRQQMIERQLATAAQRQQLEDLRVSFAADVAAKRQDLASQADAMLTVDEWVRVLSQQVPLSFKGWHPLSASCQPATCSVKWRGASQSLPLHVLELPGASESVDVVSPSTLFEVARAPRSVRERVGKNFKLDLLSFGKATGSIVTVAMKGDPQVMSVEPSKLLREQGAVPVAIGTVGRFQATFTNLIALREFARWVQPYAVSLERMEAVAFAPNVGTPAYQVDGMFVVADQTK